MDGTKALETLLSLKLSGVDARMKAIGRNLNKVSYDTRFDEGIHTSACWPKIRLHVAVVPWLAGTPKHEGLKADIPGIDAGFEQGLLYALFRKDRGYNQIFEKDVVPKFVIHEIGENLIHCESSSCHLNLDAAFAEGWHMYSHIPIFPSNNKHGLVPWRTVMVVDVQEDIEGKTLMSPLVGVLSESVAIALVNSSSHENQVTVALELENWLYGEKTALLFAERGDTFSITSAGKATLATVCTHKSYQELKNVAYLMEHAKHVRSNKETLLAFKRAVASLEETVLHLLSMSQDDQNMTKALSHSRDTWRLIQEIVTSSNFGVEQRMPGAHTMALLLPFGLPLLLTLSYVIRNYRVTLGKAKSKAE